VPTKRSPCRLPLSALAAATLLLALLVLPGPSAAADSPPQDPLALAGRVGLSQAWYLANGYANSAAALPSIEPVSAAAVENRSAHPTQVTDELGHHYHFPLVLKNAGPVEARALWITRWDYSSPADVQTLAANAAYAGFNMLLFQVRGSADSFYTPGLEPWAARLAGTLGQDPGWDPLQTAVDAAHANSLELHAYINVYPVWAGETAPASGTSPPHLYWTLSDRHGDDWRASTLSGPMGLNQGYLWATPALTEVAEHVVAVASDLVTRYEVDGLHLDLVRYPGAAYSHDPFSAAGYSEATASDPTLSYGDFQRAQVTMLVGRIYSDVVPLRPGLRLSAAVWPVYEDKWGWGYSEGYHDYYQDSQGWMTGHRIDAIMPMLYPVDVTASPPTFTVDQFATLVADFLAGDGGRHVLPGISAQYADFAEIAQRIEIARSLGAPGHAIFSARLVSQNGYWDEFAAGPYSAPAQAPPVTWHP
jgi:uncharacterized lipoprotein YddW (UPF0748 family)